MPASVRVSNQGGQVCRQMGDMVSLVHGASCEYLFVLHACHYYITAPPQQGVHLLTASWDADTPGSWQFSQALGNTGLHHMSNKVMSTADLGCGLPGVVDQAACIRCSSYGQALHDRRVWQGGASGEWCTGQHHLHSRALLQEGVPAAAGVLS